MHKENTPGVYWPQKVRPFIYTKDLVLYCTGLSPFIQQKAPLGAFLENRQIPNYIK